MNNPAYQISYEDYSVLCYVTGRQGLQAWLKAEGLQQLPPRLIVNNTGQSIALTSKAIIPRCPTQFTGPIVLYNRRETSLPFQSPKIQLSGCAELTCFNHPDSAGGGTATPYVSVSRCPKIDVTKFGGHVKTDEVQGRKGVVETLEVVITDRTRIWDCEIVANKYITSRDTAGAPPIFYEDQKKYNQHEWEVLRAFNAILLATPQQILERFSLEILQQALSNAKPQEWSRDLRERFQDKAVLILQQALRAKLAALQPANHR